MRDYRYSQLTHGLGRLLHENRLTQGMRSSGPSPGETYIGFGPKDPAEDRTVV
jgi:hypothetical protein